MGKRPVIRYYATVLLSTTADKAHQLNLVGDQKPPSTYRIIERAYFSICEKSIYYTVGTVSIDLFIHSFTSIIDLPDIHLQASPRDSS